VGVTKEQLAGGLEEVNDVFVGGWESVGECGGVLLVVWLSAKAVFSDGLVKGDTQLSVPGCLDEVTWGVVVSCDAVNTVALVGTTYGDGMCWQGSDGMFTMVVRLVAWETEIGESELGTETLGVTSPTVAFVCASLDVVAACASAMGGLEGRRNSGSRAPEYECEPTGGGENVWRAGGVIKATGRSNREGAWLRELKLTSAMVWAEWDESFARLTGGDGSVDVLEVVTGLW
jgi:hypothetical protein